MGANCATHVPQACAQHGDSQRSPRTPKAPLQNLLQICLVRHPQAEEEDVSRLTMWQHDVEALKEDLSGDAGITPMTPCWARFLGRPLSFENARGWPRQVINNKLLPSVVPTVFTVCRAVLDFIFDSNRAAASSPRPKVCLDA